MTKNDTPRTDAMNAAGKDSRLMIEAALAARAELKEGGKCQ